MAKIAAQDEVGSMILVTGGQGVGQQGPRGSKGRPTGPGIEGNIRGTSRGSWGSRGRFSGSQEVKGGSTGSQGVKS